MHTRQAQNPGPNPEKTTARRAGAMRGFTLVEVMLALSILAIALIGLIGRTANNVRITQQVSMRGIAVDLTRGKMYDIEEELLADGFQELDQSSDGDFSDEGWPQFSWEAKIEKIKLPNNLAALDQLGLGGGGEGGEGGESSSKTGEEGDSGGGSGASAIMPFITQFTESAIRRVTLTVRWKAGDEDQELVVACYFTNPVAMTQSMSDLLNAGSALGGPGSTTPGEDTGPGSTTPGGGTGGTGGTRSGGFIPSRGTEREDR